MLELRAPGAMHSLIEIKGTQEHFGAGTRQPRDTPVNPGFARRTTRADRRTGHRLYSAPTQSTRGIASRTGLQSRAGVDDVADAHSTLAGIMRNAQA